MTRIFKILTLAICMSGVIACTPDPKSPRGFRLPDGTAQTGQEVFVELQCHTCHTVSNLDLPNPVQPGPVSVVLGGEVQTIKTYGELVSSVINPSHKLINTYSRDTVSRDGKSLMKVYNDTMTVQQLIDLVAFLQSRYEVVAPDYVYSAYRYQ